MPGSMHVMAHRGGRGLFLRPMIVWFILQVLAPVSLAWAGPEGQPADVSGAEEEQMVARRNSETGRTTERPDRGPETAPAASPPGAPSPRRKPQSGGAVTVPETGTGSSGRISASSRTRGAPDLSRSASRGRSPPAGARYVDDVVCEPAERSCQAPIRAASGPSRSLPATVTRWIADPTLYGIVTLVGIMAIGVLCTLEPRLRRRSFPRNRRARSG